DPAIAKVNACRRERKRNIRADEINKPGQLWGPTTQVVHSLLVQKAAKDWLTDDTLDALARAAGVGQPAGDLTVEHILPRHLLVNPSASTDAANCVANYALLSRSTNSELADKRPNEVLAILTPAQRKRAGVQFSSEAAGDCLKLERTVRTSSCAMVRNVSSPSTFTALSFVSNAS